jgi:hypothetical protein
MIMTFRFRLNSLICRSYNSRIATHLSKRALTLRLDDIEIDEGGSLGDLRQELGRLELPALASVKYGKVPRAGLPSCPPRHALFFRLGTIN